MERVIIDFFKKNNLKLNNSKLVVAVSTGLDSMGLVFLLSSMRAEYNLKINVAHVNHKVREESKEEEEYIRAFCKANNLELDVLELDESVGNFQSFAREKRYSFFHEILKRENADYLLLAHHGIDNIETILMRLIRGSNLRGYGGIYGVVDFYNYKILRPFINLKKADIEAYVKANNIKYFEDRTNKEDIYTRNRIRNNIIPLLFEEDKNVEAKFSEFSYIIENASLLVEAKINEIVSKFNFTKNSVSFKIDEFLVHNEFIQVEVLFSLLKKYNLSKMNILELLDVIKSDKANIKVIKDNEYTFIKEYDKISILYYTYKVLDTSIEITKEGKYNISDNIEIIVTKRDSQMIQKSNGLWYNSNNLPLVARSRADGDRILLESGYKKVKDLLIDLKVGIKKRDNIVVLEKDGEVLALLGIRKSVKLKEIKENDLYIEMRVKDER